jgi:hypothetical protein
MLLSSDLHFNDAKYRYPPWQPEKFDMSDNKKALPHAEERLL